MRDALIRYLYKRKKAIRSLFAGNGSPFESTGKTIKEDGPKPADPPRL